MLDYCHHYLWLITLQLRKDYFVKLYIQHIAAQPKIKEGGAIFLFLSGLKRIVKYNNNQECGVLLCLATGLKLQCPLSARYLKQHLGIGCIMKNILLILLFIFIFMEGTCNWFVEDHTVCMDGQVVTLVVISIEEVTIRHYILYHTIKVTYQCELPGFRILANWDSLVQEDRLHGVSNARNGTSRKKL